MPVASKTTPTNATGVFMENGSGGFVSDLTFNGGMIGFRAGSQVSLAFHTHCDTRLILRQAIYHAQFTVQPMSNRNLHDLELGIYAAEYSDHILHHSDRLLVLWWRHRPRSGVNICGRLFLHWWRIWYSHSCQWTNAKYCLGQLTRCQCACCSWHRWRSYFACRYVRARSCLSVSIYPCLSS